MNLKSKVKAGCVCLGTFNLLFKGGDAAQFFTGLGFDYLILDMEHTAWSLSDIREMIIPIRAAGVAAIVRIPDLQYDLVARSLDAGAEGIMLPRVTEAAQVRDLVRFAKYRPEGERGFIGVSAQTNYRKPANLAAFPVERNREIFLFVQIESAVAMERREDILAVPGIDCCFVGSNDLAHDMGFTGQTDHPEVEAAIASCLKTSQQRGLAFSLPLRSPEEIPRRRAQGIHLLTVSSDASFTAYGVELFKKQLT